MDKIPENEYEGSLFGPWMIAKKRKRRQNFNKTSGEMNNVNPATINKGKAKKDSGSRFVVLDDENTGVEDEEVVPNSLEVTLGKGNTSKGTKSLNKGEAKEQFKKALKESFG